MDLICPKCKEEFWMDPTELGWYCDCGTLVTRDNSLEPEDAA